MSALTPERVAVVGPSLRALKDRLVAHPALCPILETGVVDIEPYVVSPVVDGDSLDVALREYGPANMADAIPRLRGLADALDAAAAVDVAHGSLHLRDILVSVEDTVLTGIGVAAVLERVGVRPPVRRPYCAPEVALGRGISPAGDQYSLAAIAHEWLSGRRVSGPDGFQVPTSTREGAAELAAIFSRALEAEPEHRYPTATAFVDALADVAGLVVPRVRGARRRPVTTAPLLEFDRDAEDPAMTLAGNLDELDNPPLSLDSPLSLDGHDDVHDADEPSMARVDAAWNAGAADDLPLVFGPRDAGGDADPETPADDDVAPVAFVSEADEAAPFEPPAVAYEPLVAPYESPVAAYESPAVAYESSYETLAPDPIGPLGASMARDAGHEPDGTPGWVKWVGALALVVVAVVVGGRMILRWGTPAPADTATSSTEAPISDTAPGGTPGATEPAPAPAPAAPGERPRVAPRDAPAAPAARSAPPAGRTSPTPAATPPPRATSEAPTTARTPQSPPAAARPQPPPAPTPAAPAARATPPGDRPAAKTAPSPAPAGAEAPGRLLVRSTPSGAEVFLNGERRGVSPRRHPRPRARILCRAGGAPGLRAGAAARGARGRTAGARPGSDPGPHRDRRAGWVARTGTRTGSATARRRGNDRHSRRREPAQWRARARRRRRGRAHAAHALRRPRSAAARSASNWPATSLLPRRHASSPAPGPAWPSLSLRKGPDR